MDGQTFDFDVGAVQLVLALRDRLLSKIVVRYVVGGYRYSSLETTVA